MLRCTRINNAILTTTLCCLGNICWVFNFYTKKETNNKVPSEGLETDTKAASSVHNSCSWSCFNCKSFPNSQFVWFFLVLFFWLFCKVSLLSCWWMVCDLSGFVATRSESEFYFFPFISSNHKHQATAMHHWTNCWSNRRATKIGKILHVTHVFFYFVSFCCRWRRHRFNFISSHACGLVFRYLAKKKGCSRQRKK